MIRRLRLASTTGHAVAPPQGHMLQHGGMGPASGQPKSLTPRRIRPPANPLTPATRPKPAGQQKDCRQIDQKSADGCEQPGMHEVSSHIRRGERIVSRTVRRRLLRELLQARIFTHHASRSIAAEAAPASASSRHFPDVAHTRFGNKAEEACTRNVCHVGRPARVARKAMARGRIDACSSTHLPRRGGFRFRLRTVTKPAAPQ